jgi:uncharacterized damage-inducible protein DinB
MSLASVLVDQFTQEAAMTRPVLEAVPEDMFAWQPHQKSMTLGQLAGHIVETPGWACSILERDLDITQPGDFESYVATDKARMLVDYDGHVTAFREALADRDDALMLETWTMRAGDKVLMSHARHDALRTVTVNHIIHHRGQLSVYLRLLNISVPATYGPTADSAVY